MPRHPIEATGDVAWMAALQLLDRRRPEERYVDAVDGPRPAPPRGARPAQGAAVLHPRGRRLVGPDYSRLPRAPAQAAAPDRRRRHPGVPLLAARAGADARLQPRHAADRGLPRPARAAVLPLDDAARPLDHLARLAGVHHRVPPVDARRRSLPDVPSLALQATLGRGPRLLRRPADPRPDDLPARAVAVAGVPRDAGRLLRHPRPAHRLPRRRPLPPPPRAAAAR